jgi:hypothetical protein
MKDQLIFFDSRGVAYRPVAQANATTGAVAYRAKPEGGIE